MSDKENGDLEERAIDILRQYKDGIFQSELWKTLGISSREGSRLVLRLIRRGVVRREEVTVNGRRTYKLYAVKAGAPTFSIKVDVSSILDIPCAACPRLNECGAGGYYDPSTCPLLEAWLKKEIAKLRVQRVQTAS
ncbi:helix-turn-helix transcriptional regulator [Acidilobus sp.]|uniref:helix-turn-helix transcriptional regulator n=1 Tax=Acidilobus sp. TaxID=1872109 RepID=UPI003CFFF06E